MKLNSRSGCVPLCFSPIDSQLLTAFSTCHDSSRLRPRYGIQPRNEAVKSP